MKLTDMNGVKISGRLDLGIVEVGKTKQYEYYLHNDTPAELVDIDILIKHAEVKVTEYPKKVAPLGKGIVKISWSPTLKVKSGLKNVEFKIHGAEIYS